nr:MAG TPA: hypothetical protein [Caudoviricetes sp.]
MCFGYAVHTRLGLRNPAQKLLRCYQNGICVSRTQKGSRSIGDKF